jgi:hypothetical protein
MPYGGSAKGKSHLVVPVAAVYMSVDDENDEPSQ